MAAAAIVSQPLRQLPPLHHSLACPVAFRAQAPFVLDGFLSHGLSAVTAPCMTLALSAICTTFSQCGDPMTPFTDAQCNGHQPYAKLTTVSSRELTKFERRIFKQTHQVGVMRYTRTVEAQFWL